MEAKKIITWGLIAAAVTGGIYLLVKYGNPAKRKQDMALFIVANGLHHDMNFLVSADDAYLEAWYKAAKKNAETFTVNGKIYFTKGGKAKTV